MNKSKLILSTIFCCAIAACGGGGSDAPEAVAPTTPVITAGVNTGSVSANFVRSANARYMRVTVGQQTFGVLNNSVQDGNGVMTTLNDAVLSGTTVTKEISGDARTAQGRWVAGTLTTPPTSKVLTGTDNVAYHYIVLNNVAAMPITGVANCNAGTFTAPSLVSGVSSSTSNTGTATGSASIAFGVSGATVAGLITASANGSTGTASLNTSLAEITSMGMTGAFLAQGAGAAVMLGSDGVVGYVLAVSYVAKLANGASYTGVANFRCS